MGLFEIVAIVACVLVVLLGAVIFGIFGQVGRLLLRVEALEQSAGTPSAVAIQEPYAAASGGAAPLPPPRARSVEALPATAPAGEESIQAVAPRAVPTEAVAATPSGFPPGTVLFEFELPDLDGRQTLRSEFNGEPLLLIAIDPACPHSRALLPDLAALRAAPAPFWPRPVLLSTGTHDANVALAEQSGLRETILLQAETEVADLLRMPATPSAYLVAPDGKTASILVTGRVAILGLAASSVRPEERVAPIAPPMPVYQRAFTTAIPDTSGRYQRGVEAGTPAPGFVLPRTDGGVLDLDGYQGRRVMLVFVDPGTEASDRFAPALAAVAAGGPRLAILVVGRGSVERNREWAATHGLTVPVAVQTHWEVSRAYQFLAAPVAYLIDEQGIVAEPITIGADAILDLARRQA